jgi:hypothetical protein
MFSMKKYLIFIFLLFILQKGLYAQYNLQLNNVKTYTGVITGMQFITLDTVPPMKVWKIEAKGMVNGLQFYVNGRKYNNYVVGVYLNYPWAVSANETLWLKAGDYISYYNTNFPGSSSSIDYVLSLLEFNLTQ